MDKNTLLAVLQRPVAFYPALARVAGGVTAGLMLCQLVYWEGKGTLDKEGWIKKSWKEFQEETCLTRDEQRGARRQLEKAGFLKTKRKGLDPTLWYKIDFDKLGDALRGNSHQEVGETELADQSFPSSHVTESTSSPPPSPPPQSLDEILLAVSWELEQTGRELGGGLRTKILNAWRDGTGGERKDRDLATLKKYREVMARRAEAAELLVAVDAAAQEVGRSEGEDLAQLVGAVVMSADGALLKIDRLGARIGGSFTPLSKLKEMLTSGHLTLLKSG